MSILPPRKRDWTKNTHQLGLFIRFPDGGMIEFTTKIADADERDAALALLALLSRPSAKRGKAT